jgi:hypothetical protein
MEVELSYNSISEERLLDTLEAPEVGAQVVFKGLFEIIIKGEKYNISIMKPMKPWLSKQWKS